jgi:hypothetical protein
MLDRESCERRVYRLATLLTGDPRAATAVIARVVDAQPDLRRLDGAHLDRLTVLRSREIPPRSLHRTAIPEGVAEAMGSLPAQQREAWVFARVYQLPEREMAKAMDCSHTAINLHLRAADAAMMRWLGEQVQAASAAVLNYSMSIDVPEFYRLQKQRQRQVRKIVMIAGASLAVLVTALLITWLMTRGDSNVTPPGTATKPVQVSP